MITSLYEVPHPKQVAYTSPVPLSSLSGYGLSQVLSGITGAGTCKKGAFSLNCSMGFIFYIAGMALASYAGFEELGWYFVPVASLVMAVGYIATRVKLIRKMHEEEGRWAIPKAIVLQAVIYSLFTAPMYYVSSIIN